MIEFDPVENRMVLKIVYYGPALSGKTTNLLRLHDLLRKDERGELMVLDTQDDRTIFFDLLPFFLVTRKGLRLKVKVYTVPGQVRHDATRKAVLQRADGVAFIADSQTGETGNNAESFANLETNLAVVGLSVETVPLVIQFNKRDLANIVAEEEIRRIWQPTGIPLIMASAKEGWGVTETFREILGRTFDGVNRRHDLIHAHGLDRDEFVDRIAAAGERQKAEYNG